jgi:tRNA pseudouridine38-40 synthase
MRGFVLLQVAHFYTTRPHSTLLLQKALNGLLPLDIRVREVSEVPRDFHARYSALNKTYHYYIHTDPVLDPFTRHVRLHCWYPMDKELIRQAASMLVGTHDFTGFANKTRDGAKRNPVRTIARFDVVEIDRGLRLEVRDSPNTCV